MIGGCGGFGLRCDTGVRLGQNGQERNIVDEPDNADLFLDTLPVNVHTTASDALWAGLPALTPAGDTFASSVAASLVDAAGLPDLIAGDLDDYAHVALDLDLDRDRPCLIGLRCRLAENLDSCVHIDSARYAQEFATLVTRVVHQRERGLSPGHRAAIPDHFHS